MWYLSGIVGLCLVSYVDSKNDCANAHLLEYLIYSLLGLFCLGVGIYAIYWHIKNKKNFNKSNNFKS
jgi:hypothetical protein